MLVPSLAWRETQNSSPSAEVDRASFTYCSVAVTKHYVPDMSKGIWGSEFQRVIVYDHYDLGPCSQQGGMALEQELRAYILTYKQETEGGGLGLGLVWFLKTSKPASQGHSSSTKAVSPNPSQAVPSSED